MVQTQSVENSSASTDETEAPGIELRHTVRQED